MNYRWIFLMMIVLGRRAFAYQESPMAPAVVDTSTGPAVSIDTWVPKAPPKTPDSAPLVPVLPDVVGKSATPTAAPTSPAVIVIPVPSVAATPVVAPPPRTSMNEMTGTVSSIDADAKTIRISVAGGFSPLFDYTDQTAVTAKSGISKIAELNRDDVVIVRYVGKDLIAKEIEVTKTTAR